MKTRALVALGGVVLAVFVALERRELDGWGLPLDDSWIHLVFARGLAAGEGLAWDGRLVGGSTAPLWTALLSLVISLPGGPVLWAQLAGAGFYLATVAATRRLGRELGLATGLAGVAGLLVLATAPLVWAAFSGLEIALFTWLALAGMVLHLRERRDQGRLPLALPVLAAATLARPEGALLLLLAALDGLALVTRRGDELAWRPPRWGHLARGLGLAMLVLGPTLGFYAAATGSPWPTTLLAKTAGVHALWPRSGFLLAAAAVLLRAQPWMTLLAAAGGMALFARLGGRRDRGLLPALWVLGLPLALGALSPPSRHFLLGNFGRYLFPLFPPLVLLGALGVEACGGALPRLRLGRRRLPLRVLLGAVLVAPTLWALVAGARAYRRNLADVEGSDLAAARWLAPRLDPRALLAVQDIGAVKFHLPNPVLDLAGIVDARLGEEIRRAAARGAENVGPVLARYRPDYLLVYPGWYTGLPPPGEGYRRLWETRNPGNATMAGSTLALYATPWTRYPLRSASPSSAPAPAPPPPR